MPGTLTEQNRSRVREVYGAYLRGNLPFVLDALTHDISWVSDDEAAAAPCCGRHAGRAAVEGYFTALAAECAIVDYRIGQMIADGDWVAVTATARARYHHSGVEREIAKVDVLRLRDGQICEFREYDDTSQIAADLARQSRRSKR